MRRIVTAAVAYVVVVAVVIAILFSAERYFIPKEQGITDEPIETESKTADIVKELKKQSDKDKLENKEAGNLAEYNRCLSVIAEFFESLEFGEFEAAYAMLSEEYKAYRNLPTIETFKEFVEGNDYISKTCDLQGYRRDTIGSSKVYTCDTVLFDRKIGEDVNNGEQLQEYMAANPINKEAVVLTTTDNEVYRISFEGLVSRKAVNKTLLSDEHGLEIYLQEEYRFSDKRTYQLKVISNYETDVVVNLADVFQSITAKDATGNVYWADQIDGSIENELNSGQEIELKINIDCGTPEIVKLNFNLNYNYINKSLEIML